MVPGDGSESEGGYGTALSMARELRTLKRRGSNLLVVGVVSDDVHGLVCRRLLGDDAVGPRRRLVVVTGSDPPAVADRTRRPDRPTEGVRHVTYATSSRSAANGTDAPNGPGEDSASGPTLPEDGHVEVGRLTELGEAIEAEIDDLEGEGTGFEPAELRVCFDSLTPLFDAHDREVVVRFLDPVTDRIRGARGVGHFHLPIDRDRETVRVLEPLFEVVVELRIERGTPQQRWHLRDADITSEWLTL